ncbi:MAG: hypothetical protein ACYSTY_11035, partial [Planctomycetota bacterium]
RHRYGFTLLEAMMAAAILLVAVFGVMAAITSGQQHAYEAQQRVLATFAAEALLERIVADSYDALPGWNGHIEPVGSMVDHDNQPLPESFIPIGRDVQVTTSLETIPDLGIEIRGRTVQVRAFNGDGRVLADLRQFVPEPTP